MYLTYNVYYNTLKFYKKDELLHVFTALRLVPFRYKNRIWLDDQEYFNITDMYIYFLLEQYPDFYNSI